MEPFFIQKGEGSEQKRGKGGGGRLVEGKKKKDFRLAEEELYQILTHKKKNTTGEGGKIYIEERGFFREG